MKQIHILNALSAIGATLAIAIVVSGCSSASDKSQPGTTAPAAAAPAKAGKPQSPPILDGVTLHKDKDIQGIWLAPGFDFKGYDILYIPDTTFSAVERPNEEKRRTMSIGAVQQQLVEALVATRLFKTVTIRAGEVPTDSRSLKLVNTIIEYEKGGGGARYFAGLYGAGQPVIKVRGKMYDGDKLVFVYEAKRSGESGGARMFGGYKSDEDIQRNDIRDLAVDLADCMKRHAKVQ